MPVPAELMNDTQILRAFSNVQLNAMEAEYDPLDKEVAKTFDHAHPKQMPVDPNTIRLSRAAVWLVTVDKVPLDGLYSRSHSFVAVSNNPGAGTRTGTAYFSISGDENRSQVILNDAFVANAGKAKSKTGEPQFSEAALAVVNQLKASKEGYASKEAFCIDYVKARTEADPSVTDKAALTEAKLLTFLVPKDGLEMWTRDTLGSLSPKTNLAERDARTFENISGPDKYSGKTLKELSTAEILSGNTMDFGNVAIRRVLGADPLKLVEAKQHHVLHRQYVDEVHQRDGSGLPLSSIDGNGKLQAQQNPFESKVGDTVERTPQYNRAPPFTSMTGNCTVGAATYLRDAGVPEANILAPSAFAFGLHSTMNTWKPVGEEAANPNGDISSRGGEVNVAGLNAHLKSLPGYLSRLALDEDGRPKVDESNTPLGSDGKSIRMDQKQGAAPNEKLEASLTDKDLVAEFVSTQFAVEFNAQQFVAQFKGLELAAEFAVHQEAEALAAEFTGVAPQTKPQGSSSSETEGAAKSKL